MKKFSFTKLTAIMLLAVSFSSAMAQYGPNLIKNGDFSMGTTNWGNLWVWQTPYAGTSSVVNGEYVINVTGSGGDGWAINMSQRGFKFETGKKYLVSFDAWTENAGGYMDVFVDSANTIKKYAEFFNQPITTTKTTYTRTITMTETCNDVRFMFGSGRNMGNTYLDNVQAVEILPSIIVNGGFESGKTGWQKSSGNWKIVSDKHSGDSAAMIPLANWSNVLVQRFNVDPQSVYEFKFWAKVSSKGKDLPVNLSIKNSKGQGIGPDPNYSVKVNAKDWTEYVIRFQTIELMDSVDLWVGDGKTDTIYLDDFEVNKSSFINNGGFENGLAGWQKSSGTINIVNDVHSGSAAALVALSNWKNVLVQRFDAEELSPYELKFWAKLASSSKKVNINLGLKNSAGKNVGPDPNVSVPVESKIWKQYSYQFNTLATVDSIDFWFGDGTTDSIYIDDIELVPASIITNGSFEAGKTGWDKKSSGSFDLISPGQSGDSAARLPLSNWKNVIVQRFNVEPVTSYEIKLWAKVSGTKAVNINLSEKNSAGKGVGTDPNEQISVSTNAWKAYSLKFSTLSTVDSIDFWIGDGVTDTLYLDHISVLPLAFTSVTGIALDSTSLTLDINGTYKLKATITPALATNKEVKWSSSDTLIAKVDVNGTVKAIAKGNATITATTVDGKLPAICMVTVLSPLGLDSKAISMIRIYPNPVTNVLKIENANGIDRLVICSSTGQVKLNSSQSGDNAQVDLTKLPPGIYVLKVYQKNNVVNSYKIVKK